MGSLLVLVTPFAGKVELKDTVNMNFASFIGLDSHFSLRS